jgi:ATP-binding cassette subfamily B protein
MVTVFIRILRYAKPYWGHLLGIFLLSILSAPLALLQPLPLKIVVDYVIGSEPLPGFISSLVPPSAQNSGALLIATAAALLVGLTLLNQTMMLGLRLMQTHTGESMLLDFRALLFICAQRLSLRYHDSKGASETAYRIQYDAPSIPAIIIHGVIPLVTATATLFGMIYVTAQIDMQLAIVALFISPALFLLVRAYGEPLKERWTSVKRLESSANAVLHEVLSSMRVVKAFGREEYEGERFRTRSHRSKEELQKTFVVQGRFDILIGFTIAIGMAATLYIGAWHVQEGTLSLGSLILVLAYVAQVYEPLRTISSQFGNLQGAIVSAQRAFAILDETPEVIERENARRLIRARGEIVFSNVSFGYERGQRGLHKINFAAPAGTRIGIQGQSGAGKSTLINLLTRFYDVDEGNILMDGIDARDYKLQDYRNQFSVVLQDPVLLSASIAENIAYGRPTATLEEIIEAAKSANAHDFISAFQDEYETLVGDRGMRLSGGERQRISLARAFLRDAPILVLDEPTSSIDIGTESAILGALHRLMCGRTTFIIAHRLTTLDGCDMRLEIMGGRATEVPSRSEIGSP